MVSNVISTRKLYGYENKMAVYLYGYTILGEFDMIGLIIINTMAYNFSSLVFQIFFKIKIDFLNLNFPL